MCALLRFNIPQAQALAAVVSGIAAAAVVAVSGIVAAVVVADIVVAVSQQVVLAILAG